MSAPTTEQLKEALKIAADALEIASEWIVTDIEIDTPKEWNLNASCDPQNDGWVPAMALVEKLRSMAS